MKRFFLAAIGCILTLFCYSQKKFVSNDTHKYWNKLDLRGYGINGSGKFIYYQYGSEDGNNTLVVASVNGRYHKQIFPILQGSAKFATDEKNLLYMTSENKLSILDLNKDKTSIVENVSFFETIKSGNTHLIVAKILDGMIILNLSTGHIKKYPGVEGFYLNDMGTEMVYKTNNGLAWLSLPDQKVEIITSLTSLSQFKFDKSGEKLTYIQKDEHDKYAIYLYKKGTHKPRKLVDDSALRSDGRLIVDERSVPHFNTDGKYICFTLFHVNGYRTDYEKSMDREMQIWAYNDLDKGDEKIYDGVPKTTLACIYTEDSLAKINILADGRISIVDEPFTENILIKRRFLNDDDIYWNIDKKPIFELVSLENGIAKTFLPNHHQLGFKPVFSPNRRFIYWYDINSQDAYTYEVANGVIRNVTKSIKVPNDVISQYGGSKPLRLKANIPVWLSNEQSILISDKYDIWQIDPLGLKDPINITGGVGRKKGIFFELETERYDQTIDGKEGSKVILRALDEKSKNNGFWTVTIGNSTSLTMHIMAPYLYSWNIGGSRLKKAKNAEVYMTVRQSANESPNLFISKNLKNFYPVSSIFPERDFNWIESELVTYPLKNGKTGQGILYKPGNFDPKKKYPVIFNFYQKRSDELHLFRIPELFTSNVIVPWYVSNEYLVFMPDIINSNPGEIVNTALDAVESAIDHLGTNLWFDTTKIGLQGQSFGGYETYIIIANSKKHFAAAQAMAGQSNVLSRAFGLAYGKSAFSFVEKGQPNFDSTIWERPDIYIKNSPVLQADKINTPLLIQHNRKDENVPLNEGTAMYYALRRLHKPVWLIQYTLGSHGDQGTIENSLDFTIRQQQFFDHYLKGKPKPKWMVDGSLSLESDTTSAVNK